MGIAEKQTVIVQYVVFLQTAKFTLPSFKIYEKMMFERTSIANIAIIQYAAS